MAHKPQFGPKGSRAVTKTEAGRLKFVKSGSGLKSVPETITKIMREIPGKAGKAAPDFVASAKRVLRPFPPIIGKSVKRTGGVPDVREMTKRTRVARGDKSSSSSKVSKRTETNRGGATRGF